MHKAFIQKLTEIVEANLANEKFGPEELAKESGMSHSNINRKLKITSNQNVSQFIREIRLKKGKELLLNEDFTIAEISYRVGFGSPTYFNNCFREYFGIAPGELRNQEPESEPGKQQVEHIRGKSKRTKILIGLVVLLIVLIPVLFFITNNVLASKNTVKEKSIAVLSFKYLGDEVDKQYLAHGMMDAILAHLSKIKDLRVISDTNSDQYKENFNPLFVFLYFAFQFNPDNVKSQKKVFSHFLYLLFNHFSNGYNVVRFHPHEIDTTT